MTKRMLINATHQREEIRVAMVNGQLLDNLDIERTQNDGVIKASKADIFIGRITRIERSLEAAFVDYGAERHGFLPLKEISKEYFREGHPTDIGRANISELLKNGQEVLVQIDKEERGNKGAALTTFIALAGCYLVLMPNNPRAGGISRRIEGEEREELRDVLSTLEVPEGMGIIVRTAGLGRNVEELEWDLKILINQWAAIQKATRSQSKPGLIYQESDIIMRAIRDYLRPDISEILIDNPKAFERAREHIRLMRPDFLAKIKPYEDPIPLFSRYQIENQIETAFKREVTLENGGSLVIDPAEALIAIDINSAKATSGGDIEETAFQTNLAAAKEIARQLRLRDLGGLIVIDFIDMSQIKHQRAVENALKEELKNDRARVQVGRISRFGLLEMSRQRLKPSLGEHSLVTCPQCQGQGSIRGVQSLALAILRILEEEAMKAQTAEIHAQLPVDLATYLLNEKRDALITLEHRHAVRLVLIPNPHLLIPHYEITRIRHPEDDTVSADTTPSYERVKAPEAKAIASVAKAKPPLSGITPPSKPDSLIKRLWSAVFGADTEPVVDTQKPTVASLPRSENGRRSSSPRQGTGHMRSRSNGRASGSKLEGAKVENPKGANRAPRTRRAEPRTERSSENRSPHRESTRSKPIQTVQEDRSENWGNISTPLPDEAPIALTLHEFPTNEVYTPPPMKESSREARPRTTGGSRHPYNGHRSRNGGQKPLRTRTAEAPPISADIVSPVSDVGTRHTSPAVLPPKKEIELPPPTAFETGPALNQVKSSRDGVKAQTAPPKPTREKPTPKIFEIPADIQEKRAPLQQVKTKQLEE